MNLLSHDWALFPAYAAALGGWLLVNRLRPALWRPLQANEQPAHPYRELLYAVVAAVLVLLIGQLYVRGRLIPDGGAPLLQAVNQLCIFAPMVLLPVVRRHGPETAWLDYRGAGLKLLTGALLAGAALLAYTLVRRGAEPMHVVLWRLPSWQHIDELTQVFLEDLTIAILLVRLKWALRSTTLAVLFTAILFAAGHIPAMLSEGVAPPELLWLIRDVAIGVGVLAVLFRSRDILWFVPVHFTLDMTQFEAVSGT